MTDEQIIKAADICRTGKCSGCPYHELYTASCLNKLTKDVYHLLNRKKAEIENLKVELKAMRGAANSYKLENERLLQKLQQGAAMSMTVPNTLHHTARIAVQTWTRRNEE